MRGENRRAEGGPSPKRHRRQTHRQMSHSSPTPASNLSTRLCLTLPGKVGGRYHHVYSCHVAMRRTLTTVRPQGIGPLTEPQQSSLAPGVPHIPGACSAHHETLLSLCSLGGEGSGLVGFSHSACALPGATLTVGLLGATLTVGILSAHRWAHPTDVEVACLAARRSHLPELRELSPFQRGAVFCCPIPILWELVEIKMT